MTIDWQERERMAQYDRTMPIWSAEPFWTGNRHIHCHHYVHVSTADPKLLAYTESDAKGQRDIQTRVKPGKYLTKYFSDILTAKQIKAMATWQVTGSRVATGYDDESAFPLEFATDEDSIVEVYETGPDSCMSGSAREFDCSPTHPVSVYAAGDLAVAWLRATGQDNKPIARCLVWPEKKVAGRVYPTPANWGRDGFDSMQDSNDCYNALYLRLKANGYRFLGEGSDVSFNGAKIEKTECDDGYVMPYLDNSYGVNDRGDYFVMASYGADYACSNTNGTIECDSERCERCEDRTHGDSSSVVTSLSRSGMARHWATWCSYCADNYTFYCEGINDRVSEDDCERVAIGDCTYSQEYAESHFTMSDFSGEFIDSDDTVDMENGETWSTDEFAENGFTCEITGENLPNRERHPDYPTVSRDCDSDDIRDHFGLTDDTTVATVSGRIESDAQGELV